MNLTIDIGNTRAKLTAFKDGEPTETLVTDNQALTGLKDFATRHSFSHVIVANVIDIAPEGHENIESLGLPVLWFHPGIPVPLIQNTYRTPHTLGADRLAAVVGAVTLSPGRDLLIIDAGSCITYDLVDSQGCYLGGNISPGLHMRLQAMHEHTGRLPLVEAEGSIPPVGYDTETAIRSGAVLGIQHEVAGTIHAMRLKRPSLGVYLTGGDHLIFDASTKSIIKTDSHLVARGLNSILEHNL